MVVQLAAAEVAGWNRCPGSLADLAVCAGQRAYVCARVDHSAALAAEPGRAWLRSNNEGVFLFSTNFALFYYASKTLASGLLAVVFASASLLNLFYCAAVFRTPIRPLGLLAAILGFGGIVLLFLPEISTSRAAMGAMGLCLLGTLSFCTGNMVSTAAQRRDFPVIGTTALGNAVWRGVCGGG